MQKKVGIFSKIHAYLFIKTRREFVNLRRLLMKRRRLLEILKIRLFLRLAHFLFIPKFAYPAIGTKHFKNLFYEKERIYQSVCGLKGR